jgi:hypothetical protein
MYGNLFNHSSDLPTVYTRYSIEDEDPENWLGYYLYPSQHPLNAITEADLEDIYFIQGKYWSCGKLWGDGAQQPYWVCACNAGKGVRLKYGDMVSIKTDADISDFEWTFNNLPLPEADRPFTEYYEYTEQADYTPYFIEMDTTDNPLEIAAFLEDSCVGASTVFPEDTMVMVPGYTNGMSGDVVFEEYYGPTKDMKPAIKDYWVMDERSGKYARKPIRSEQRKDYYYISLKERKAEEIVNYLPAGPDFEVYPNPAADQLNISYEVVSAGNVLFSIRDLLGKEQTVLFEGSLPEGHGNISCQIGDLPKGTYILSMRDGAGALHKKMIILR